MHILRVTILLASTLLFSACGPENKQEPSADAGTEASRPAARPASFGLCQTCHSDEKDRNVLGPSLFGVVGRKAGTEAGFSYSPALKASDLTWDEAHIDAFIQDPRAVVPGTKMSFAGIKDADKRAEIIRYLATLK